MAILITNQSHFKPLSFEEMLKPYQMLTEEYNAVEKGIADLDAEAATIKQLAMSEPEGSETRTRYEQYAAELESKASDLANKGYRVICAGLDTDFRGEPFGVVGPLMAISESVTKLTAICNVCGGEATKTQRIIDGKPAFYDDPIILVGEKESYEARCRCCHEILWRK
jgi:hypothetical protein